MCIVGRGRTSLDQLRVLGPGRGEGRSFRKKNCGAQWRVPASCPWTLRAVPDWAPPGIPEAPAPTPVWIVLGCQSVAAAQLVRGSHSLGARKPRASQERLPRAPLSGRRQPRWQPAASAWLPASRRVAARLPAREPRSLAWQPHAADRPGRFAFKWVVGQWWSRARQR